jgi:hypothetical protein
VRRKGWVLNRVYEDVASGKDANRPEPVAARHALASGLVGGLVVTGWTGCPGPSRTSRGCSTRPGKRSGSAGRLLAGLVVQLAVVCTRLGPKR